MKNALKLVYILLCILNNFIKLVLVCCEVIAMATYTAEIYTMDESERVKFSWSYFLGWIALAILFGGMLISITGKIRIQNIRQLLPSS